MRLLRSSGRPPTTHSRLAGGRRTTAPPHPGHGPLDPRGREPARRPSRPRGRERLAGRLPDPCLGSHLPQMARRAGSRRPNRHMLGRHRLRLGPRSSRLRQLRGQARPSLPVLSPPTPRRPAGLWCPYPPRHTVHGRRRPATIGIMPDVLAALIALVGEHRRCGELDGGLDSGVVWLACSCGGRLCPSGRAARGPGPAPTGT